MAELINPAEIVAQVLEEAGLELVRNRDLFLGPVYETGAEQPTRAVFVTNDGGAAPAPYLGDTGDFYRGAVEVTVREEPDNFPRGEELARQCLHACQRGGRGKGLVSMRVQQSSPEFAGEDDEDCPEWVFRVEAWWTTSTPSPLT